MVGYSRDDFDAPVDDYDFSSIDGSSSLIDQMGMAGGFTATKLSQARDILRDSIRKANQDEVLNWLSFPACLCATGTSGARRRWRAWRWNSRILCRGTKEQGLQCNCYNMWHS